MQANSGNTWEDRNGSARPEDIPKYIILHEAAAVAEDCRDEMMSMGFDPTACGLSCKMYPT